MPYKDLEKQKEYNREYYKKNKERLIQHVLEYQKSHKEERKIKDARYRKTQKCRDTQKRYSESEKGINTKNSYRKEYVKRIDVKLKISKNNCNKEFSPLQNGLTDLSRGEMSKYVSFYSTATTQSLSNNKFSKRKGVCYDKFRKKWCGYLKHSDVYSRKYFDTEEAAISYRIYLENKFYTPRQLSIRDMNTE